MGCLFPKPTKEDFQEDIENVCSAQTKKRKSTISENRFMIEDKRRRSKAKSVRLRKNQSPRKKDDRARKARSVNHSSSKKNSSRLRTKTVDLPKCHVCSRPSNVMYGSGRRIIVKVHGKFQKKTFVFCSKDHAPSCVNCEKDDFDSAIIENWDSDKCYYCSENCYSRTHRVRDSVVRGTEKMMGSAMAEMRMTEFENDFDEMMRKVAPILSATMSVPTCRYCRCPFLKEDKIQMIGALKAHMECAMRGHAVYTPTRKKPKEPPMAPRILAGFYIYQIEKDIKKCKQILPHKDPLKYAQAQYQYIFVTEMMRKGVVEVGRATKKQQSKKQMHYLFVNFRDERERIEKIEGMDPVELTFLPMDSGSAKTPKTPRSPLKKRSSNRLWSWKDVKEGRFKIRHQCNRGEGFQFHFDDYI